MSTRFEHVRIDIRDAPTGWTLAMFSKVAEINPKRSLSVDTEYPFIPMDALSADSPRVTYVERRIWNHSNGSKFQKGDVLLARITPSAENGKTAIVDVETGFGSTEFIVLSPKKGGIEDDHFLYYAVKFDRIRNQAIQRMTGSTGRQRIPPEAFDDIMFPVPPVAEQQKIASILSTVDNAIQKTDEIIAKTQQLKKGLMQQLLTKGIGHTKFKQTEIGQIPEEWGVRKLTELLDEPLRNGVNKNKEDFGFGIKFVNVLDVFCPFIIDNSKLRRINATSEEVDRHRLRSGDILVVRSSLKKDGVAYPALFEEDSEPVIFAGFLIRIRPNKKVVCPPYLLHYLRTERARQRLISYSGTVAITNVTQESLETLVVPIPTIEEQQTITSILSILDDKIEKERTKKDELEQLKKGLMQVLLTGKVRVKVN